MPPTAVKHHRRSLPSQLHRWTALGAYFGYPKCCVKDFLIRATKLHTLSADPYPKAYQRAAGRKQGFVPCPRCAINLLLKRQGPESLIRDRKCTSTYPHDGSDIDAQRYVDTAPRHDDHHTIPLP